MANKKPIPDEVKAKKERYVTVNVPITKETSEDKLVGVNDKMYQIQRGKNVSVPLAVYEQLRHQQKAERAALDYEAKIASRFNR